MGSSPLLKFLDEIFEWIYGSGFTLESGSYGVGIPWRRVSQLRVIRKYVSTLGVDSDLGLRMYTKWGLNEVWQGRSAGQSYKDVHQLLDSFMQDLTELFKVQKVQQLPLSDQVLNKNELQAALIGFLFHIQYDGSDPKFINTQLMEELRSIVAILGDTPFQATEDEQVLNIWAEFEGLANEAGRLVHSFIFAPHRISDETMEESLVVLLESIDSFKGNIKKFLNFLPSIPTSKPKCPVDSLFIVDSLVCDLEDLMDRDDDGIAEIKDWIKMLHQELLLAQPLIKDINEQHDLEIEELKEPTMEIRDVACEAECLINHFLVGDVPLWYLTIRLDHVIHNIKLIRTKFPGIKANYDTMALNFGEGNVEPSKQVMGSWKVDDEIIVGFEEHESNIMDRLVAGGRDQLQIISIFGMAGGGKTTLAKKLYNHSLVSSHFDRRTWCTVSQVYKKKNILIEILLGVDSGIDKNDIWKKDEDFISHQIYRSLIGRRYIIVMDDIWNSNLWDDLQRFFPNEGNGSRILFTSRIKDGAPSGSDNIIYELPILSNDQCWTLLEKKVFRDKPCPPHLQEIGKSIATKCHGLPLAVVAIAGILLTQNKEESTWENVAQHLGSHFFIDRSSSIMQILKLSYKHLPRYLKPCFLLFGAFPEDAKISVKKLTRLWVAEGFIRKELNKSAETIAEEYLTELIDKSLVMVAEKRALGGVKACIIHDLLRKLCLKLAEEKNFLTLLNRGDSLHSQNYQHLCLQITQLEPDSLRSQNNQHLHFQITQLEPAECLVPYGPHFRSLFYSLPYGTSLSLLNMKLLRVLDSNDGGADSYGIEFLLHLRYLAIKILPNSIDRLVNLEFLILHYEVDLSTKILNSLVKLRHLSSPTINFVMDCDPKETSKLEFLSAVFVNNLEAKERLKYFPHLRKLKFVSSILHSHCLDFGFLTKCEALNVSSLLENPPKTVNAVEYPSNVKRLSIGLLELSSEKMSIIGELSKLEVLKLKIVAIEGKTWETRDGEFQQLRFLKIERLDLVEWNVSSAEHFPKLQRLIVMNCPNLVKIPCEIGDIESLKVIEVGGWCQRSLVESAREIEQEQLEMGNEEPKVIFKDIIMDDDEESGYDISYKRGLLPGLKFYGIPWAEVFCSRVPDDSEDSGYDTFYHMTTLPGL